MSRELSNLSNDELKNLYMEESMQFREGMDKGLPFDTLKEIRISLKEIQAEMDRRKTTGKLDN